MKKSNPPRSPRFTFLKGALILSLLTSTSPQGWGMEKGLPDQPENAKSPLQRSLLTPNADVQGPLEVTSPQEGNGSEEASASTLSTDTQVVYADVDSVTYSIEGLLLNTGPQDVQEASVIMQPTPVKKPETDFRTPKAQIRMPESAFTPADIYGEVREDGYQTPNSIDDVDLSYETSSSIDSDEKDGSDRYYSPSYDAPLPLVDWDAQQKRVNELNQKLRSKKYTAADLEGFYIAHYRGFHYLRDRFHLPFMRRAHYRTSSVGRSTYAPAVYDSSQATFSSLSPTKKQVFDPANELSEKLQQMSMSPPAKHWTGSLWFRNKGKLVHQRISNSYDGFASDIKAGRGECLLGGLSSTESPYVAAADGPRHASYYAFGTKLPKNQQDYQLKPSYRKNGKPKHRHLGKVLVLMHPLFDFLKASAEHVPTEGAKGEINPGARALWESETTFPVKVEGKYVVMEESIKVPSLNSKEATKAPSLNSLKSYYSKKYGISPDADIPNDEDKFCKGIAEHQATRILKKALRYVVGKHGALVYNRLSSDTHSDLSVPQFSLVRGTTDLERELTDNVHHSKVLHKQNKDKTQREISKIPATVSQPKTSKPLFSEPTLPRPHFYGIASKGKAYYRLDEGGIRNFSLNLIGHRSIRSIRQLLLEDVLQDWGKLIKAQIISDAEPRPSEQNPTKRQLFVDHVSNFSRWNLGFSGLGMLKAATYLWHQRAKTHIKIWMQDPHDSHLLLPTPETMGPNADSPRTMVLNVLKTTINNVVQYIPLTQLSEVIPDFEPLPTLQSFSDLAIPLDEWSFGQPDGLYRSESIVAPPSKVSKEHSFGAQHPEYDPWYNNQHITGLLNHHLANPPFYVSPAITFESQDLLVAQTQAAIGHVIGQPGGVAVMPLNLHGNHWVGAVFYASTDEHGVQHIHVIYNNPDGSMIDAEGNTILFVETIQSAVEQITPGISPLIVDLQLRQQHNGDDCGPFTVDNLTRLARAAANGSLSNLTDSGAIVAAAGLSRPYDGSAEAIRKTHRANCPAGLDLPAQLGEDVDIDDITEFAPRSPGPAPAEERASPALSAPIASATSAATPAAASKPPVKKGTAGGTLSPTPHESGHNVTVNGSNTYVPYGTMLPSAGNFPHIPTGMQQVYISGEGNACLFNAISTALDPDRRFSLAGQDPREVRRWAGNLLLEALNAAEQDGDRAIHNPEGIPALLLADLQQYLEHANGYEANALLSELLQTLSPQADPLLYGTLASILEARGARRAELIHGLLANLQDLLSSPHLMAFLRAYIEQSIMRRTSEEGHAMLTLLSQILGYQIVVYASNGAPGAEPLIVGVNGLPVLYLYHTSYDGSAPGSPNHYNTLVSSPPTEPMSSTLMMPPFAPTSVGMLHNLLGSWI